jgi:hypothetical protein
MSTTHITNNPAKHYNSYDLKKPEENMNDNNKYNGIILQRFFDRFQKLTYHEVPISKFFYFQFRGVVAKYWNHEWAKSNFSHLDEALSRFKESEIYSWADDPYPYDPHPDGVVLMRGGFVDIASRHLPRKRYFLISHAQSEVDLIKADRPAEDPHCIEEYSHDNPAAVQKLNQQVAEIINENKHDPILGSPKLLQWFQGNMPKIVRIFDAVKALFDQMNVGAVLTISSINWMESALNLFAKARRIPSFTGQHGLIVDEGVYGSVPVLATKKLVWGKATQDWYQKYGVPESRVAVVGSPRFDIITQKEWWDKAKLCQALEIDPQQKIMVFTTQRLFMSEVNVPIVLEGLQTIPNVFLLLLLHPSENMAYPQYQRLIAGHANCAAFRFGHISLYDALSGADFFITGHSTSALEAMLFKLPVITVEPKPLSYSYGDAGASLKVTNAAQFNQVVNRLLADQNFRANSVKQYQDFINRHCLADGLVSKRIFDLIEAACQNGGMA